MRARIYALKPGESLAPEALREVAQGMAEGRIAVFPTDTVYGLGASGLVPGVPERLYALKGRDPRKALPILIHSEDEARRWVRWTPVAEALAARFWPGPLTLVLEPTEEGRYLASPGASTLAVRVPAHPVTLALLKASGAPWASTSANLSGRPAFREGRAAAAAFGGAVDYVVDAGAAGGVESSVVDAVSAPPKVLREGALSRETILNE